MATGVVLLIRDYKSSDPIPQNYNSGTDFTPLKKVCINGKVRPTVWEVAVAQKGFFPNVQWES